MTLSRDPLGDRRPVQPAPITRRSGSDPIQPPADPSQQLPAQAPAIKVSSSNTPAQQKNDKHDDHDDHDRSNTDVHGLVPPLASAGWLISEPDLAVSPAICSQSVRPHLLPGPAGHLATRQGQSKTPPPWSRPFSPEAPDLKAPGCIPPSGAAGFCIWPR